MTPTFVARAVATLVFSVASRVIVVIAAVFGAEAIGLSKAGVGANTISSVAALVGGFPIVVGLCSRPGVAPAATLHS